MHMFHFHHFVFPDLTNKEGTMFLEHSKSAKRMLAKNGKREWILYLVGITIKASSYIEFS